ncbi:MAG: DUF58 domain-containing protein [Treponema sp.]|nr:DUF58 domain-containing protein [Treponema sp.]
MAKRGAFLTRFNPIITPLGAVVLFISLIMLIRSLLSRNSYEIVLSSAVLLLFLVIAIIGIWKTSKYKSLESNWKTPSPMTAGNDEQTIVTGLNVSVPLFFRLHYFLQGHFFPNGKESGYKNRCIVSHETSVIRGETSAQIPLEFLIAGVFLGDGFCRLRDIFGFFSFSFGKTQHRTVNIRSAPCFGKKTQINAQTGAEDRRNKPAADIERYYMREYTPGDRYRDINWKSSDKIDSLITRISTDNQEKVSRIEVHFRNFASFNSDNKKKEYVSLEALWLLDRAKAQLTYFIRSLLEQNSTFIFDVKAANGSWEISNTDELEIFLDELAGISFLPPQYETAIKPGVSDLYVFSTACDKTLPIFITACNPRPVTLFIVQPFEISGKAEMQTLYLSDFEQAGLTVPARWFNYGKIKPLGVQANKVETFYANVKSVHGIKKRRQSEKVN